MALLFVFQKSKNIQKLGANIDLQVRDKQRIQQKTEVMDLTQKLFEKFSFSYGVAVHNNNGNHVEIDSVL